MLLAAGELFSEQVRDLESEAVAGDVASVVATTCRRYEALGDANARWAAMGTRAPEVADGLARGRLAFQAWLQDMLGDLMPGDEEHDERRRVLLGLHAALDVFTWKLLRRDLGLSPHETETAADRPRAGRARPASELTLAWRYLFAQWDGGGSLPPELTVVRELVATGHVVTVLGEPVTEPEVRAVGVTDFRPWVKAPHHVTRSVADDYVRDWEVRNPMRVLGNLMDTVMVRRRASSRTRRWPRSTMCGPTRSLRASRCSGR